jgi:hypothetical protein
MKTLTILWLWIICSNSVLAQYGFDHKWVFTNLNLGGNILNFDEDSLSITALGATEGRSREALACMSDKEGNLLFYTNNCTVYDKNHKVMENGEGLNPGQIQAYWCSVNPFANPNDNSVIILPMPGDEQIFQIFHWDYEAFKLVPSGVSQFGPLNLYQTVVDISQNNGIGKVVSKNKLIISDTFSSCALQAVRHANGRDWWVIAPEFEGNCYYKILLDPSGPHVIDKQCIGSDWGKYGGGSAHFAKNGTNYVRCDIEYGLNIFNFDRCTGQLSNPIHIPIGPQGMYLLNNMTISQSGRFAYYHTLKEIYQYDLEAQEISSSKTLVATFDGYVSAGNSTDFYKSQLAPNGKIYINSFGPVYYLHVIEHPDLAGLSCEVRQHAIELPNRHFASMPNYPDYRLGVLEGSFCDTISSSTHDPQNQTSRILIYPNPSSGDITIQHMGGLKIERIDLFELTGNTIPIDIQQGYTIKIQNQTNGLNPGFYILKIVDVTGHSEVKKVIIK